MEILLLRLGCLHFTKKMSNVNSNDKKIGSGAAFAAPE